MRIVRTVVGLLALLVLAGSLVLTAVRFTGPDNRLGVLLESFTSLGLAGFVVSLVVLLALLARARPGARSVFSVGLALSILGLAVQAFWLSALYVGSTSQGHVPSARKLTVMSLNTKFGHADPAYALRLATTKHADVLVLEEVTPQFLAAVDAAGLARLLPHRAGLPSQSASGTMVFAKSRLSGVRDLRLGHGGLQVRVHAAHPFTLFAVHTNTPWTSVKWWSRDLRTISRRAAEVLPGDLLVVGDFNATRDHRQFRDILGIGLRDADELADSGWQPTWPSDHQLHVWGLPVPSLVTIDHVLVTSQYDARRTTTYAVRGTDHRALVAQLSRRSGSAP